MRAVGTQDEYAAVSYALLITITGLHPKFSGMDFDKIREICFSFPGTTEGLKWDHHMCYMVVEKIFCMTSISGDDQHVTIKVGAEDFEALTERDGIGQASHMARNQWVSIERYKHLKPKEWEHYLRQSYELIRAKLPKKVQNGLDA
jgi:predicted DNA-binding protein (MmcQ/YjbR family)